MRHLLKSLSLAALVATSAMPAAAAEDNLFSLFKAVCLDQRADYDRIPETARKLGFEILEQNGRTDGGTPAMAFAGSVKGERAVLVLTDTGRKDNPDPDQRLRVCSVTSLDTAQANHTRLADWVGLEGFNGGDDETVFFTEDNGVRIETASSDKALASALARDGYFLIMADRDGDTLSFAIGRATAP